MFLTKQKILLYSISILLVLQLCACSAGGNGMAVADTNNTAATADTQETSEAEASTDETWSNVGTITLGSAITYTGTGISVNDSIVTISAGGDYELIGTLADGQIIVNTTDKVKLRLSGVDITCSTGSAIFFQNAQKAFITITEDTVNKLEDSSVYTDEGKGALFSNDTLEIKGSGILYVNGNYKHGIASDDDIIIENGSLIINAVTDGIHANDNVTITGGDISITSGSDGIESEGDVIIQSGILNIAAADDGIHAETDMTIDGGTIEIAESYEGIEAKNMLTINEGNIRIKAADDALNTGADLVINGGYIYADCEGDGYDANGSMTMNGGTSIVYSGNNGNGPVDTGERNAAFIVNGGTAIVTGGNMRISVSEVSEQYSLWISGQFAADTLINIQTGDGTQVETFMSVKSAKLIFYTSDKLTLDTEYVVSTTGTSTGTAVDGVYSDGVYAEGIELGTATMSAKSATIGSALGDFDEMGRPGNGQGIRGESGVIDRPGGTGIPDGTGEVGARGERGGSMGQPGVRNTI